jgi:predicted transcriptional regulator
MTARRRQPLADVLGPLEAEVMEIVWDRRDATVRDVHKALSAKRRIAYTTVMTTMGRLTEKGVLRRVDGQPAHHYFPLLTREQYASSTVKSVVDWLVNHFRDPAVAYFIDRVEEEDVAVIDSLREAIQQREAKEQGGE